LGAVHCNEKNEVIRLEYYDKEQLLFTENDTMLLTKFPFYKISFIEKIMGLNENKDSERTVYSYSAEYKGARSIVQFISKPVDLEEDDILFINRYLSTRNAQQMIGLYHKKAKVKEDDKEYYILFQDENLQYIHLNNYTAVYYYIGGINTELKLLSVGFTDVNC
jgi:hypothetical protein